MNKKLLLNVDFLFFKQDRVSLNKSNNLTKWLCLLLLFVASFANAATITSTATGGNWNTPGTWNGNVVPGIDDDVIILNGATVTVDINSASCKTLTVGLNVGTATIRFNLNSQLLVSGIITLGNSVGTTRIGVINMTNGGNLICSGFKLANTGANVFTPGLGTVQLTATNTIPSTKFTTFNNLICSAGVTTMGAGLTINGNIDIYAVATFSTASTFTLNVTKNSSIIGILTLAGTGTKTFGGDVIINSDGIWNETGVATISYSGNLQNDGTYIANTGTHSFNSTNKIISGTQEINIPNLTINSPTTNTGELTVSTSLGGNTTTLTNTGTLNYGGTSAIVPTLTATSPNNTVNYIGAATQLVKPTTYINLILSGAGTKTFGTNTYSDNLTIASNVVANLGTNTLHTTKTLTLGGLTASSGIWGSTASTAPNKNDTFFTNNVNGRIDVNSSCALPTSSYTMTSTNGVICSNATGSVIGLSGSQTGVNYQLFRGSVAVGSVVTGTGNAISFGAFNATGTYVVKATRVSTLCTATIVSSVNIISYSSPAAPEVLVTNATCPTDASGGIKVTNLAAPGSLLFAGANKQYVDFGTPMLSNRSSFTVEGWIKFDKTKYTERMSLFGQNDVIEFGFEGNNLRCWTANGGSLDLPISSYPGDNGWHHIALVGTGTRLTLYLDGVSKATSTNSSISSYGSSSYTAKIGYGVMDDVNAGTAFTGEVFKLGFWSKALDATEILNMSKGFVVYDASQAGLLAGYSFNEGTGNTISSVGSVASSSSQGIFKGTTGTPTWKDPYTYAWTSASGYSSSLKDISNLLPGTYNLTTSLKDCISTGSWEVKANAIQTITTSGSINTVCFGTQTKVVLPYSASTGNLTSYSINWNAAANAAGLANQTNTAFAFTTNGGNINTINIPLSLVANTYSGVMTVSNGTCSQTQAISLIVKPLPSPPTIGTITPASCTVSTGSVVLNGLPATGTWEIVTNPVTVTRTGSGESTTISGLAPNTYTFTVKSTDSDCTSKTSVGATISGPVTNTWNGSNWSHNNTPPTIYQSVVFAGNYNSASGAAGNLEGCSCTVNSGINVTINSGATLTIVNSVNVNTALNTSLTFENNASLVQIANVTNTGSIVYKRISSPMKALDYTYWSSPVLGQTLNLLSPNSDATKFYYYNNGWKAEGASNPMIKGKGYIIRVPRAGNWPGETVSYPYAQPVAFKGVPNNGDIQGETITAGNFYLVGNPYPSALDADKFRLDVTNNAITKGTLYFWTHNTAIRNTGTAKVYASDDYASYNGTGGTETKPADSPGNIAEPSGKIAAGQSFMVESKGAGTIVFNNGMRVAGENNQFFRPGKTSKGASIEKNRVWLNLINDKGAFKQILIGYIEGATNGEDDNFDGASFNLNSFIDFYSINDEKSYSIQGRALPFTDTDLVPLGYSSTIKGDFTIEIDKADGSMLNQIVYLEDKTLGTIHNLTQNGYTFTTAVGTFDNRFVLRYTNKTLGTGDFETVENEILVSVANKEIAVNAINQVIDKVFVYDISGKLIHKKDKVGNPKLVIENLKSSNQVLLIKVVLENKHTETKKVIF